MDVTASCRHFHPISRICKIDFKPWGSACLAGRLPWGLSWAAKGLWNLCGSLSASPASELPGAAKALWNLLRLSRLCRSLLFTSSFVSAALLLLLELTLEVTYEIPTSIEVVILFSTFFARPSLGCTCACACEWESSTDSPKSIDLATGS